MKVLDAQEFHNGLQQNIQMLARLEKEMQNIKTQVETLTQMEESLKGQGGEALRSFYAECHLPFLQFFLTFEQSFTEILQQIDTALSSLEPDQAGYIQQAYLENALEQGLTVAGQTTGDLTDEANAIMHGVSDIVSLPKLNDSDVQTSVSDTKAYRDQTITNLMQFDSSQTNALNTVQSDLLLMNNWIKNIEAAMTEGVTDVNFPAEQWKAFTLQHPLQQQLAYRALSFNTLPGMNNAMLPGSVYGANPYTLSNVYTDDSLPLFSYDIASANVSTSYVNDTEESEEVLGEFSYIAPEDLEITEEDNGFLDKALGWGKTALDFFILDDVKTIADPDASLLDKGIAIAAFIPVGKLLKVPKALDKLNVDDVVEAIGNGNISKRHDEIAHEGYYGRKDFRTKINNAIYSPHDNKHLKARNSEEAKRFSETGKRNAQYLPDVNNKVIEKEALQKGHIIDNGNNNYYFIYDTGKVIGYDNGKPTTWIRGELTSGNVYHGHPIAGDRLNKYLRQLEIK